MSNQLKHDNPIIGVNFPVKSLSAGTGLVGGFPWPVHNAAGYKDRVPAAWLSAMGPRHAIFFLGAPDPTRPFADQVFEENKEKRMALMDLLGVRNESECPRDREMWFDFQAMNNLDRHAAVVIGVQGLNALTGLPTSSEHKKGFYNGPGEPKQEQYPDVCPVHGTQFADHRRMCQACGFEWPFQNYVTNSVSPNDYGFHFWWDGWRGADGKIQQFAMRPASSGMGVAQQVLGEDRALGLSLAVFLKKQPKPVPSLYRQMRGDLSWSAPSPTPLLGGGEGSKELQSFSSFGHKASRIGEFVPESQVFRGGHPTTVSRIGAPSRMEVAAGRTVDQKLYPDVSSMDEWREEPEVIFTLIPVDMAWAAEVTKNGPTTREIAAGPFAGLKSVG